MRTWKQLTVKQRTSRMILAGVFALVGGGLVGRWTGSTPTATAAQKHTTVQKHTATPAPQKRAVPTPKGPLPGDLLIADEGNKRLLIVTPQKKIVWSMNLASLDSKANTGADDAFLTPDMKHIIINEENNQVIALISIAKKKIIWTYGHPGVAGSKPGYLNTPDDAYMLPNGLITVADIKNRRILVINPKTNRIVKQIGNGIWTHNPPISFAAPNGDTPLPDGGMLVTEIDGSYADRLTKTGKLVYTVHFPNVTYPSDTQLMPNGDLMTVDYSSPGRIEIVTPKGQVVWDYYYTSGNAKLNHPSLAIRLPNGYIALNDDYNDRVIIVDPKTKKIVWQYGHTGQEGSKYGYLAEPDGIDFVPPSVIANLK